jgi:xylulose-5-phosphate/fructose-6-phosphate phosphoketolase
MASDKVLATLKDDAEKWSVYSQTRSTIHGERPLSEDELDKLTRYFHACLYLCLGMLYLKVRLHGVPIIQAF